MIALTAFFLDRADCFLILQQMRRLKRTPNPDRDSVWFFRIRRLKAHINANHVVVCGVDPMRIRLHLCAEKKNERNSACFLRSMADRF